MTTLPSSLCKLLPPLFTAPSASRVTAVILCVLNRTSTPFAARPPYGRAWPYPAVRVRHGGLLSFHCTLRRMARPARCTCDLGRLSPETRPARHLASMQSRCARPRAQTCFFRSSSASRVCRILPPTPQLEMMPTSATATALGPQRLFLFRHLTNLPHSSLGR